MAKWKLTDLLKITMALVLILIGCTILTYFTIAEPKEHIYHSPEETGSIKRKCVPPTLPVESPEIMKFVYKTSPINCSMAPEDWVVCKGTKCSIKDEIWKKLSAVSCSFTDIYRFTDDVIKKRGYSHSGISYNLEKSDVVHVSCRSSKRAWSSTLTGVRKDRKVWERSDWHYLPSRALEMNVLIFGLESMSQNAFIRKLPKTYNYLVEQLGGLVLEGYNTIGDAIPQGITPILTGKTKLEIPKTMRKNKDKSFLDMYSFIWKDFQDSGYVTAYFEDIPQNGKHQHTKRGFNKVPTDHYMRPYYVSISDQLHRWPEFCAGSVPRHQVMMNHILDFFSVYKSKPKFLFGFLGELSHDDCNQIGAMDDDFLAFLKDLATENTLLVIMSDHGQRFGKIRETFQGKQEERLPFVSFRFPPWFKYTYENMYQNFITNTERLTTPFDVHATLKSVLDFKYRDHTNRTFSLFDLVPSDRSCAEASISPHWCACLEWTPLDASTAIVQRLSNTFIETVNNYTAPLRKLCSKLEISKTLWALKLNRNGDQVDSFEGYMKHIYQVRFLLKPGHSLFEATIDHYWAEDKFVLKMGDISRINKYGRHAKCVECVFPHLRKYCYCLGK